MNTNQPSRDDRLISHAVVALASGAVVGSQKGLAGFVGGAVVGVLVHEAFDAPLADLIADLNLG